MNTFARHVPGLAALVAGVALAGEPGAGPAPARAHPADPGATVATTRYESFLAPKKAAPSTMVPPPDHWIEANRTVASFDSMSLTMGGSDAGNGAAAGQEASPPQGSGRTDHTGHSMPEHHAADPHIGHTVSPPTPAAPAPSDPHAAHGGKEKK